MDTPLVFFGGKFMPLADAKVGIMTHALHYGTAVFEGIRGNWSDKDGRVYIFRPREHYIRFLQGCSILRMKLPYSADDLVNSSVELVERSGYQQDLYIRPIAFKSAQKVANLKLHELEDDLAIIAIPFGQYLDVKTARCITASWRRMEETMIPPRVKISGLYVNSILAKTDAVLAGYDEAILLNQDGHVAEGSGENLFIVQDGKLVTPPLYNNILGGITRDSVVQLARNELGMETVERPLGRTELYLAQEVFLTGTAAHLTAVGEIDNRKIADGNVGPVTQVLQDTYFKVIHGQDPKYRHWCTPAVPARLARV